MNRFPFAGLRAFLKKYDDSFVRINWGGCAASANILLKHLLPIVDDYRIVSCERWADENIDIDKARAGITKGNVYDWNSQGIYFDHVWVEFKWNNRWYAIDSEGLHTRNEMYSKWSTPYKGSFTPKELEKLTKSRYGWNDSFSKKQIPNMKRFAKKHLKPLLLTS